MDSDMLTRTASRPAFAHVARKFTDYLEDEGGSIAIFIVISFVMILMLGGIAVDIMRFEMRRVALQETLDRATLAAANVVLPPTTSPQSVVTEWFDKAGLGNELTVDYFPPTVGGSATASSREATARAKVRSYNHFMQMLEMPYIEGPAVSVAQQGVSKIEVMMVLDITGSMSQTSGSTTKIAALRQAASNFVTILKYSKDAGGAYTVNKDPNNLISIGMVPYASNVNVPDALRDQFNVTDVSSWDGVANAGVNSPDINCLEIPTSTYSQTGLSTDDTISMAPVVLATKSAVTPGTNTTAGTTGTGTKAGGVITLSKNTPPGIPSKNTDNFVCNHGDNFSTTGIDESASNQLLLPTTNITTIKNQIAQLNPRGRTSIAVGMRWGTAMIDEDARPIYTSLRGSEAAMLGRPANNDAADTRKIIVLMTDGTHVASENVIAPFKTGLSPIWRGTDGNMVIRYTNGGLAKTGGLRPGLTATTNTCSGWVIPAGREFFAPHLKENAVKAKFKATDAEGLGSGTAAAVTGACDPRAWISSAGIPSWPGSGTVRQLDWSEVWRYASVDWVIRQLYMRSGVDGTNNYTAVYNQFVAPYLGSTTYMDTLLNTNCTAAKTAGIEVFGIILGDNVTETPIKNCSSPGTGYYYKVTNADNLNAAFEQIAVLISDLKLTQ